MQSSTAQSRRLKDTLPLTGADGEWEQKPNSCWRFKCRDKAGMNWAQGTGKIWFDGPDPDHVKEAVPKLASRLQAANIQISAQKIAHASA